MCFFFTATEEDDTLQFVIYVRQEIRVEKKGPPVLTRQIFLQLWSTKLSIFAHYILTFLTLRCA